jgi:ATP-dependent Clp protease adaptor protein ClpS
MNETVVDTVKKTRTRTTVKEPPQYRLIFMNDDVTTFEFVVETLVQMFDYEYDGAEALARQINEDGSGVVVVLPYELAEQKGIEVTLLARSHGFPLQVRIEPAVL